MHILIRRDGIERVARFVRDLVQSGALTQSAYKAWRQDPRCARRMAEYFGYTDLEGVPSITSLVSLDFHPRLPLVMLNYSPVAHNTLHTRPEGWTPALRMCRGIVFDHSGRLVAHPYPKFFNLGEHPEAMLETLLRQEVGWTATEKMDGHLGIIFEYEGELIVTTRGRFSSPSAQLADGILRTYELAGWRTTFQEDWTMLVEIIDPTTKVHVEYGNKSGFVLTGMFNRETLEDATPNEVSDLATAFGIPIANRFSKLRDNDGFQPYIMSLRNLVESMKDRYVHNAEGYVIQFSDGIRVKIKYDTYIQLMVAKKLSPKYLMQRIMSGNLDRMLSTLDEEIVSHAHEMLGRVLRVLFMRGGPDTRSLLTCKHQYLYGLVPPEESTAYYRSVCRNFLKYMERFQIF